LGYGIENEIIIAYYNNKIKVFFLLLHKKFPNKLFSMKQIEKTPI